MLLLLAAAPARATCPEGSGINVTATPMAAARAVFSQAATPSFSSLAPVGTDLVISELRVDGDGREFIEIYNPTSQTIQLDDYYLSDYASEDGIGQRHGYWEVVTGAGFQVNNVTDFVARFPPHVRISAGQALTVATGASTQTPVRDFLEVRPDFEILDTSNVTDMLLLGGTPNGALTRGLLFDNAEFVMLFKWDGACDLVCDVDYQTWGRLANGNTRADKTGVSVDGPDGDSTPTAYLPDVAATQQELTDPPAPNPVVRTAILAGTPGGNGCMVSAVPVKAATWSGIKALFR